MSAKLACEWSRTRSQNSSFFIFYNLLADDVVSGTLIHLADLLQGPHDGLVGALEVEFDLDGSSCLPPLAFRTANVKRDVGQNTVERPRIPGDRPICPHLELVVVSAMALNVMVELVRK